MKKLWCRNISCSSCTVTNDIAFKLYKGCGFLEVVSRSQNQQEKMKTKERLQKLTIE